MVSAAGDDGVKLIIGSAYRSYRYGEGLFRNVMEIGRGSRQESAMHGKSQHQLGTVVDFSPISDDFAETAAFRWLKKNAAEYGFSLSFPDGYEPITGYRWESWHYRYLGREAAMMTEKYFEGIQHYFIVFMNTGASGLKMKLLQP